MSRINTNVSSLIAQRVLRHNNDSLNKSLERLSTGLKINKGADNPAGLIASENLRSEITGINQAVDNSQRASNVISSICARNLRCRLRRMSRLITTHV